MPTQKKNCLKGGVQALREREHRLIRLGVGDVVQEADEHLPSVLEALDQTSALQSN